MAMMMSVSVHAQSKMLGDVDGDGEIGIKTPVAVTTSVADIDGDHAVTVMDGECIRQLSDFEACL